jgi:hypothetical protein
LYGKIHEDAGLLTPVHLDSPFVGNP